MMARSDAVAARSSAPWLTQATALTQEHAILILGVVAAITVRIVFWAVTDRTWEDALTTLAHVRNAAEGLGLTHHPGEGPVHGFTSALSVLIPLSTEIVVSGSGLTAMRVASLAGAAIAIGYGYAIARHVGLSNWPTAFVVAYLALDQLHIFYGMSGMETQVAVAILLAGCYHLLRGHDITAGIVAGLAVLARPDLILWAVPVLLWSAARGGRSFARTAISAGLVVAPWLIFTTAYYGTPVPHTVLAKATAYSTMPEIRAPIEDWLGWGGHQIGTQGLAMLRAFMPFYEDGVVVAAPLPAGILSLAGLAMIGLAVVGAWRLRAVTDWWPAIAYVALFFAYWCVLLPPVGYFNWYLPPFTALVAILVGSGFEALRARHVHLSAASVLALTLAVALHLPFSIPLERRVQIDIDDGVRRTVGLYLSAVVPPGQAVVTEPAGYIGYYSRAVLWDHPGLTSPTARAAISALSRDQRNVAGLVAALSPPWAVLRPWEWETLARDHPYVAACYEAMATFGTPQAPVIGLNGLVKWNQDWSFTVYRRGPCATSG